MQQSGGLLPPPAGWRRTILFAKGEKAMIPVRVTYLFAFPYHYHQGEHPMISLRPVRNNDKSILKDTSYAEMTAEATEKMLADALAKSHAGKYFELFAVMDDKACVGFVSLYETAPGEISCGPEIKPQHRRRGYGYLAVRIALERANLMGYTKAIAQIRQDNTASIALHQKLGFAQCRSFLNRHDHSVFEFQKPL